MLKREKYKEVWIGGALQRSPSDHQVLQWRDLCEKSRAILDREGERIGYNDSASECDCGQNRENFSRQSKDVVEKGSKFARVATAVQTLLKKYYCVPPVQIRNIIPVGHSDFNFELFNPLNEKYYISACDVFNLELNNYTLKDFKNLYACGSPVFYSSTLNAFDYYHDRETSVYFLNMLLKYQYNDCGDRIRELLGNIVTWFNKLGWRSLQNNEYTLNPKINCICVHGPPNSGKNYFWDCFAAVACNVGHIGRVSNKTNPFSLQECYNRRLVMGNELNMEDGCKDDFKKLCEGAAFNIRVKHKGDQIFKRTPSCFISNSPLELIGDRDFINVRLVSIYWTQCAGLANSMKKPYPLAIFDLFDMYNVTV